MSKVLTKPKARKKKTADSGLNENTGKKSNVRRHSKSLAFHMVNETESQIKNAEMKNKNDNKNEIKKNQNKNDNGNSVGRGVIRDTTSKYGRLNKSAAIGDGLVGQRVIIDDDNGGFAYGQFNSRMGEDTGLNSFFVQDFLVKSQLNQVRSLVRANNSNNNYGEYTNSNSSSTSLSNGNARGNNGFEFNGGPIAGLMAVNSRLSTGVQHVTRRFDANGLQYVKLIHPQTKEEFSRVKLAQMRKEWNNDRGCYVYALGLGHRFMHYECVGVYADLPNVTMNGLPGFVGISSLNDIDYDGAEARISQKWMHNTKYKSLFNTCKTYNNNGKFQGKSTRKSSKTGKGSKNWTKRKNSNSSKGIKSSKFDNSSNNNSHNGSHSYPIHKSRRLSINDSAQKKQYRIILTLPIHVKYFVYI